jgi:predicted Kef-type K+ transport protein
MLTMPLAFVVLFFVTVGLLLKPGTSITATAAAPMKNLDLIGTTPPFVRNSSF